MWRGVVNGWGADKRMTVRGWKSALGKGRLSMRRGGDQRTLSRNHGLERIMAREGSPLWEGEVTRQRSFCYILNQNLSLLQGVVSC